VQENPILVIREKISNAALRGLLDNPFPDLIKFVVDVEKRVIALEGELHADAEDLLLQDESAQEHLWGGNIYPDAPPDKWIEYTALINIRPSQDNRSMEVLDPALREKMSTIISELIDLTPTGGV